MTANTAPIRASDKLQILFERDDRLIDLLANRSPQLAKLRHSVARGVMARVTTVAQAARLCNLPVRTLVQDLNHVLGIDAAPEGGDETDEKSLSEIDLSPLPTFSSEIELDVRDDLAHGSEPFSRIMSAVAALKDGEALRLRAPFEPVPLFAVMGKRGFGHSVERHADDDWSVWFFRRIEPSKQERAEKPVVQVTRSEAETAMARGEVWLDVRGLEPPEPMVQTLEALESLPNDNMLVQVNSRVPQFLLPILRDRGFHFAIDESQPSEVQVRIWRNE